MPRNEGFLDPGAGPLASFAWDLRALREKAGKVPYRVLAKRAGFCASTLSVAASGAKLPSLDVTLAYVQACGAEPEAWRARWHELDAQLQLAQGAAPDAQPGLEFAPPYDADESGEPARLDPAPLDAARIATAPLGTARITTLPLGTARLDTVPLGTARLDTAPLGLPLGSSQPVADYVPVARDGVSTADRDDAMAIPAPDTAAAVAPNVSGRLSPRPSGRPRWRSRFPAVSVGRIAIAALTLATAILGLRVATSAVANPPQAASTSQADIAMQQADALYTLIYQYTPFRSDTDETTWEVSGCRNLSNAQNKLRSMARKRHEEIGELDALNLSSVPDHAQLVAALRRAWIISADADTAYANIAADLQTGCTSGAVKTDPNYQQADAYAQTAAAVKNEAAQLWNANADELGQLGISGPEL